MRQLCRQWLHLWSAIRPRASVLRFDDSKEKKRTKKKKSEQKEDKPPIFEDKVASANLLGKCAGRLLLPPDTLL